MRLCVWGGGRGQGRWSSCWGPVFRGGPPSPFPRLGLGGHQPARVGRSRALHETPVSTNRTMLFHSAGSASYGALLYSGQYSTLRTPASGRAL